MSISKSWLKKQGEALNGQDAKILFKIIKQNNNSISLSLARILSIILSCCAIVIVGINDKLTFEFWGLSLLTISIVILSDYIQYKNEKEMEKEL